MELIDNSNLIVIKIGSSIINDVDGLSIREDWLLTLIEDIADLKKRGKQVIIVSSGAVTLGKQALKFDSTSKLSLIQKQAASACGQIDLINIFALYFRKYKIDVSQILINIEDSEKRKRIANLSSTISLLLFKGIIPIISENHILSASELRYGDNDRIAAIIAKVMKANLLIMLSDIDGLYDYQNNKLVQNIYEIDHKIDRLISNYTDNNLSADISIKVSSAKQAVSAGCNVILSNGYLSKPISRIENSNNYTIFYAEVNNRKEWILSQKEQGQIHIKPGSLKEGQSIVIQDVKNISGEFKIGSIVSIKNTFYEEIGKGIIAFSSEKLKKLLENEEIKVQDDVIHFNDIALFKNGS